MKLRELRDGRIVITARADRYEAREFGYMALPEMYIHLTTGELRPVTVGDEGTLGHEIDCSPTARSEDSAYLNAAPDGIPGNLDHRIRRHHGWRGTTNDIRVEAWGRRTVLEVSTLTRGIGWKIVLSPDILPEGR